MTIPASVTEDEQFTEPREFSALISGISTGISEGTVVESNGQSVHAALPTQSDILAAPASSSDAELAGIVRTLTVLGHAVRLQVLQILLSDGPTGLSAGHLASQLALSPSSLSFHLSQMVHEQLLTQRRAGRQIIYAMNRGPIAAACAFLEREILQSTPIILRTSQLSNVDGD
jgi:ArsR family transcriptional regulator, arsenate/arsenite/antimonite-responsive transcriptional repressor